MANRINSIMEEESHCHQKLYSPEIIWQKNNCIYKISTSSGTTNSMTQPVFENAEWVLEGGAYK